MKRNLTVFVKYLYKFQSKRVMSSAENLNAIPLIIKCIQPFKYCTLIACLMLNFYDQAADSDCLHVMAEETKGPTASQLLILIHLESSQSVVSSNK